MPIQNWPYTDLHNLNLDWILKELKNFQSQLNDFALHFPHVAEHNNGAWDSSYNYDPNEIVFNDTAIYIAKTYVPVGISIENPAYWLKIADLQPDILSVNSRLDAIEKDLDDIDIQFAIPVLGTRYHVNGITGSDNNDGLSASTPFRTLEPFFALYDKGHNDIRCYIDAPGSYPLNREVFTSVALHITARASDVILDCGSRLTFYNSHINFAGDGNTITISIAPESELYFENCATSLTSVVFDNALTIYGGSLAATTLSVPRLTLQYCNYAITRLTITNTNGALNAITATASFGRIFDESSVLAATTSGNGSIIRIVGGYLSTNIGASTPSGYAHSFSNSYGTVIIRNKVRKQLATATSDGEVNALVTHYIEESPTTYSISNSNFSASGYVTGSAGRIGFAIPIPYKMDSVPEVSRLRIRPRGISGYLTTDYVDLATTEDYQVTFSLASPYMLDVLMIGTLTNAVNNTPASVQITNLDITL